MTLLIHSDHPVMALGVWKQPGCREQPAVRMGPSGVIQHQHPFPLSLFMPPAAVLQSTSQIQQKTVYKWENTGQQGLFKICF